MCRACGAVLAKHEYLDVCRACDEVEEAFRDPHTPVRVPPDFLTAFECLRDEIAWSGDGDIEDYDDMLLAMETMAGEQSHDSRGMDEDAGEPWRVAHAWMTANREPYLRGLLSGFVSDANTGGR